jgi:MFS family permease
MINEMRGGAEGAAAAGARRQAPAPDPQSGQDERTVRHLRYGVGVIGVLLPVVLPLGTWIFTQFGHQTEILPSSMSSSYYTGTRNIFVGALCALGVFLIGYRFNPRDDRFSTVAGLFAIGVALCPTAPRVPTTYQSAVGYVHLSFAGVLLCGLAMFCISSFRDPAVEERRTANHAYLTAGVLILAFLATAVLAGVTHWGDRWTVTPLYVCESLSVWAFGVAWIAAAIQLERPAQPARAPNQSPALTTVQMQ